MARKPLTKNTRSDWREVFCDYLRHTPNITLAARAAGYSRAHVYNQRKQDEQFAQMWDDALAESLDRLEARVFERAEEESDTLAIFLLKCHRPERYGQSPESSVPVTVVINGSKWTPE